MAPPAAETTASAPAAPVPPLTIVTTVAELRALSRAARKAGKRVALVPTMGYLHAGHLSLVKEARSRADVVIVSLYVNPGQFAPGEDFASYPRDSAGDRAKLAGVADILYEPATMYVAESDPGGPHETHVTVSSLAAPLCGRSRPVFLRGVATVVAKLLHAAEPDVAVFGKKDYQQWRVVARMVRDLDFAVDVVGVDTAREPDGLAMSSRNARLTADHRTAAVAIPGALKAAAAAVAAGQLEPAAVVAAARATIAASGAVVDYVEMVDAHTLAPVAKLGPGVTALLAVAATYGNVRLIDNVELTWAAPPARECTVM